MGGRLTRNYIITRTAALQRRWCLVRHWQSQQFCWTSYMIYVSHYIYWCSIRDHRHRLLLTAPFCVLYINSNLQLRPQHVAVDPSAVRSPLRPWLPRFFLHLSPIAGIPGAALGMLPPRRSPRCNSMKQKLAKPGSLAK